jgi:uncharacterized membrane protein
LPIVEARAREQNRDRHVRPERSTNAIPIEELERNRDELCELLERSTRERPEQLQGAWIRLANEVDLYSDNLELERRSMIHRRRRLSLPAWGIPASYAVVALAAGLLLPRLEARLLPGFQSGLSSSAALAIFASIGSGMIALTGIVFSLAFVMVQFSSTAYSPRLVLWIARDATLWHAMGVFSATFLYAIAAMAWVDRSGTQGTPLVSSWLVFVLLFASVGMFIALIERLSLLQIHRMLGFTADHGRRVIDESYPPFDAAVATPDPEESRRLPVTLTLHYIGRPATIQALDVPALLDLASAAGAVVVVIASVGDTLVESGVMLRVHGGTRAIDERALRAAFVLGSERTFEQDPKYAIRLLVDIAIRALSPAVNDPTTAVQALDHIEDLLLRLGRRRLEIGAFRDGRGTLRLAVPYPEWDDFLNLAFDEIRHCGATSVQVMRRMKALAADLIRALPPERHQAVQHHQHRLDATIASSFQDAREKQEASVEDRQGLGIPRA